MAFFSSSNLLHAPLFSNLYFHWKAFGLLKVSVKTVQTNRRKFGFYLKTVDKYNRM